MPYAVVGANILTERKPKPYDFYCPEAGSCPQRMNMYKASCLLRQQNRDKCKRCIVGAKV